MGLESTDSAVNELLELQLVNNQSERTLNMTPRRRYTKRRKDIVCVEKRVRLGQRTF